MIKKLLKQLSLLGCITGLVAGLVITFSAQSQGEILQSPVQVSQTQVAMSESHGPEWGYGGANNPTRWGSLSSQFELCDLGESQSPINLTNFVEGSSNPLRFDYGSVPLAIENNGHTIQVNYQPGNFVAINDQFYELVQFHFHTPSEHTVNGKAAAMELHLVHKNDQGQFAVVGVMIEEGEENPFLTTIWENMPSTKGKKNVAGKMINGNDFLPVDRSYYHYEGSLTTPPCSQGIHWNVLATPIEASAEQIADFMALYQVNARPVQPVGDRIIQYYPN